MKREIKLLDKHEAEAAREYLKVAEVDRIGTRQNVPYYISYNNTGEIAIATGRATCRLCGQKIAKGLTELRFIYDEEGNSWTAKEWHIHANGCPDKVTQ